MTITRDEFEKRYASGSKMTIEQLKEYGLISLPCSCGEEGCRGWQMRGLITFTSDYDFMDIPEQYRLEIENLIAKRS